MAASVLPGLPGGVETKTDKPAWKIKSEAEVFYNNLFAKHPPYGQYIGLEADFIRVRAWMGLGPEPSDEEILAKYGSFAAYINLRKSMTGETEIMCGQ